MRAYILDMLAQSDHHWAQARTLWRKGEPENQIDMRDHINRAQVAYRAAKKAMKPDELLELAVLKTKQVEEAAAAIEDKRERREHLEHHDYFLTDPRNPTSLMSLACARLTPAELLNRTSAVLRSQLQRHLVRNP